MAQGDKGHGGGSNNGNKRGRAGRAPSVPVSSNQAVTNARRAPGGTHIVGPVPPPQEPNKRPVVRR